MKRLFGAAAGVALAAFAAMAQDANADKMKVELQTLIAKARVVGPVGGVMGKVVKGAPYSAQEVSESTQMLADGTRIHNETKVNVYRDSEGRVRRENGDQVTIWDPVANVSYSLDTKAMTARKSAMGAPVFVRQGGFGMGVGVGAEPRSNVVVKDGTAMITMPDGQTRTVPVPPNGEYTSEDGKVHIVSKQVEHDLATGANAQFYVREGQMTVTKDGKTTTMPLPPDAGPESFDLMVNTSPNTVKKVIMQHIDAGQEESLGEQTIEGVKSTGTRHTSTIEAGAIGNDRPISTVTERWYSNELQTEIMTRRSDPRMGESVFKLTNVNRSEPAAYLFQVPNGYTVSDRR